MIFRRKFRGNLPKLRGISDNCWNSINHAENLEILKKKVKKLEISGISVSPVREIRDTRNFQFFLQNFKIFLHDLWNSSNSPQFRQNSAKFSAKNHRSAENSTKFYKILKPEISAKF